MALNPNEADVVRDYGWLLGYLSDTQVDGRHGPMDALAPWPIRLDALQAGDLIWIELAGHDQQGYEEPRHQATACDCVIIHRLCLPNRPVPQAQAATISRLRRPKGL